MATFAGNVGKKTSSNLATRLALSFLTLCLAFAVPANASHSVARLWNDVLLDAVRNDYARPTVHARNLFHVSVAMWDSWAAYDDNTRAFLHHESAPVVHVTAARNATISYAVYRLLKHRFKNSPGAEKSLASFDAMMAELGYDTNFDNLTGATPAALGNRIAATLIEFGANDGANEREDYAAPSYLSVNRFHPLLPFLSGNRGLYRPSRWQPLAFLDFFVDQAGNQLIGPPPFLGPHWGGVTPFALSKDDMTTFERDGIEYPVYHDPGSPPQFGDKEYREGFMQVVEWSGKLDPADGVMIDVSPNARGGSELGSNNGKGRPLNPATDLPYAPQMVPAGDYYRVLAEFWADGPDSETPPGHWFSIANYVSDHPGLIKRIAGDGPLVGDLEWDVKLYVALGGAMHDAAVAAWGVKGWYDYVRPISVVRYMAGLGQRTDSNKSSYHPEGVDLVPGSVELVTLASISAGERHEHLAGPVDANLGEIAVYAWRGPQYIKDPDVDVAGVGWILLNDWWPYQRPNFVTPPFAGYVSGHSTFSRAAAELMTLFTGDEFFPAGLGEFKAQKNQFLVFEEGPSVDVILQWATYRDASDETSISRIYGGIHPRVDDIPGRFIGAQVGINAFKKAFSLFDVSD